MRVEIVTPRGPAWQGEAEEVTAPGQVGDLGVLEGHVPLLAALRAGVLRLRVGGEVRPLAVGSGLLQVGAGNRVAVLTSMCEAADHIDLDAARRDYQQANTALGRWDREIDAEWYALAARRAWADARIEAVTGEYRNGGLGALDAPNLPESPPNPAF
jgi:F-type H+-transporting ATPase subunit epsilon